jgi:hypothetical protein
MLNYPQKFDSSKLNDTEKKILSDFKQRRDSFNKYLEKNFIRGFTCPCCGYPTIIERGSYEICEICFWEDDTQDDNLADEIWGGPNGKLSLTEARLNISKTLDKLANELNNKVNVNQDQIEEILEKLKSRSNVLMSFRSEKIKMNTRYDDPVWNEYKKLREDTLKILIKKL